MAGVKVKGMDQLIGKFDRLMERSLSNIYDYRVQVARELTEAMIANIPVWSGRTMSSITWGAQAAQTIEPHPQRGGFEYVSNDWHADPTFGKTSQMPLGSEPMFAGARAKALAEVESLVGFFGDKAVMTINSVAWSEVELGNAPGGKNQKPRNHGVVSEIALQQVRAKFPGLK